MVSVNGGQEPGFGREFQFDSAAAEVVGTGMTPSGLEWVVLASQARDDYCLQLAIGGAERDLSCGFDIPSRTDIGFSATLDREAGFFIFFGLTSSRVHTVRLESTSVAMVVPTHPLLDSPGPDVRGFWAVRPPVEDVTAIVGLAEGGSVVQRLTIAGL